MPASKADSDLAPYRARRSPDATPEPFGGTPTSGVARFVVQHHAARATHFDFRLELAGTLKSWAVPKGPSPDPADKRLAVRTEDHPLDYADFEGTIPAGNYGAGAVIVWDQGRWRPIGDPVAGLEQGKLLFELQGHKLRGNWTLVKTRRGPKDWLLIKEQDDYVDERGTAAYPADSVLSGLTVAERAAAKDPEQALLRRLRRLRVTGPAPGGRKLKPMLARSGPPFSHPDWLFEIKYDGYRLLAEKTEGTATLWSRNGHDLTATFPEIARAVLALPYPRFVLDGETVVHDHQGLPSFARLQKRGRLQRAADIRHAALGWPATLYAFDLLSLADYDLRPLALTQRKQLLAQLLPSVGTIRYCDHIRQQGEAMYRHAQQLGLEGIVAKRADSRYQSGRSDQWRKIAITRSDDFVIAGYTSPRGSQPGFGALLLAQYVEGTLHYRGRVGSGFTVRGLQEIAAALARLQPATAPAGAPAQRDTYWVSPVLVAEVRYKQLTLDGLLRAAVFQRLRDDKSAPECTSEQFDHKLPEPSPQSPRQDTSPLTTLTNTDKVFWPDQGYTKGDLLAYYESVAHWLLPFLRDRPVVLTRYPDGIDGKSFFQKDAPAYVPDWLRTEPIWSEQAQREIRYFVIDDLEMLRYVINMGTIPLHIWSSRAGSLEQPDWCIVDLDPKQASFADVVTIARELHRLCEVIGLDHAVKTSGATGLHILIPLGAGYTYAQSRNLGELLARVLLRRLGDIATITRSPAKRGAKVYLDYLQNRHGQTIAAPYAVRPLPGAPVSMPLAWREVNKGLNNARFNISNARARLRRRRDEFARVLTASVDLLPVLERLQAYL